VSDQNWHPSASLETLRLAAKLREVVRQYMHDQDVLEVFTPSLSKAGTTDPHINSFEVDGRYLHTSPEFPMKRLLAAYQTDIYQLCRVFRDGELGRFHNQEFSMLEWYRIGYDHHRLMKDLETLMASCSQLGFRKWNAPITLRYTDEVARLCSKPFNTIKATDIENLFTKYERPYPSSIADDFDAACDLLMDEFVIRDFPDHQATFIVDYPASQASLARTFIDDDGLRVAARFELYWGAIELANGFHELTDTNEQAARFKNDLQKRQAQNLSKIPMDEPLLAALAHGLPDCSGVALGIDRLLMILTNNKSIADVLAFPGDLA